MSPTNATAQSSFRHAHPAPSATAVYTSRHLECRRCDSVLHAELASGRSIPSGRAVPSLRVANRRRRFRPPARAGLHETPIPQRTRRPWPTRLASELRRDASATIRLASIRFASVWTAMSVICLRAFARPTTSSADLVAIATKPIHAAIRRASVASARAFPARLRASRRSWLFQWRAAI